MPQVTSLVTERACLNHVYSTGHSFADDTPSANPANCLFSQVPRGFICPLTLDIMTQPALLISSNIAVPSSYESKAISRWLAESR